MKNVVQYLEQNESIVWEGNPNCLVLTLTRTLIPTAIITPLTLLIVLGLLMQFVYLIVFVPFMLFLVISLMWQYYLLLSKKGYPTYYITSKNRILILAELNGPGGPLTPYEAAFSLENIRSTLTTQNAFEKMFGTNCKTIIFYLGFQPIVKQVMSSSGPAVNAETQLKFKMIHDMDLQTKTIAYTHNGRYSENITFDSVESPDRILSLINQNNSSAFDTHPVMTTKPSLKGLLLYGLITDAFRLGRTIIYSSISLLFLGTMIYILDSAPKAIFPKIVGFYLPKILLVIITIFSITSSITKILIGKISPQYEIVDDSLILKPRRFRILSDPPQERIELSKIKHIWRIRNFIDNSNTTSYLLAIQLSDISIGQYRTKKNVDMISKLLRLGSGALTFRLLLSLPSGDEFVKQLGNIEFSDGFEGNFFEKLILYSFFV